MPATRRRTLGSAQHSRRESHCRILFCATHGHMVLLHGFIKKTQKTPEAELDMARKRQKEVDLWRKPPISARPSTIPQRRRDPRGCDQLRGETNSGLANPEGHAGKSLTKTEMARRMETSRAHLDRLLDPENPKVQLDAVERAASALGRRLRLVLV